MKPTVLLVLIMLSCIVRPSFGQAQTFLGEIRGKLYDSQTKKPIDYASVTVLNSRNKIVAQVRSDDDGAYIIKPLSPDEYTIRVSYLGYLNATEKGVKVDADQISFMNIRMDKSGDEPVKLISIRCCFGGCRSTVPPEETQRKKDALISLQREYKVETDLEFNCVLPHKSRSIENGLKEESVKLFNEVRSFPNPTQSVLNIESMYDGSKGLVIQNLSGQEFFHGTFIHHVRLDVSTFPLGLYVITVIDKANDEKTYSKFIVAQ